MEKTPLVIPDGVRIVSAQAAPSTLPRAEELVALQIASEAAPSPPAFNELPGRRYKIKPPTIDAAIYIIIVDKQVDGRLRPWELFIETKNQAVKRSLTLTCRMVSAVFRNGGSVQFVAREFLDGVLGEGYYQNGRKYSSIEQHIGIVLEHHLRNLGFGDVDGPVKHAPASSKDSLSAFEKCPACGERAFVMSEGCGTCNQCGHTRCS